MSIHLEGKDAPVAGDSLDIERDIKGIIATDPVVLARLTIKVNPNDPDPGVKQKVITAAQVPGLGQIAQDGSELNGNGTASLIFQFSDEETLALGHVIRYFYDVQGETVFGKIYTGRDEETGETVGRLRFRQGITKTPS